MSQRKSVHSPPDRSSTSSAPAVIGCFCDLSYGGSQGTKRYRAQPPSVLTAPGDVDGFSAWDQTSRGDTVRFLLSWVRNPLRTAAIAPSSKTLAQLITSEIGPPSHNVIELGPGTGVFTRALLKRGIHTQQLTLLESNSQFVSLLQTRFPTTRVLCWDAARDHWPLPPGIEVGAVISGLPLLSMPEERVFSVLAAAFTHLRADGKYYQFTYARRCPVSRHILESLDLQAARIGGTWRNLPPASVFQIQRRRDND
ncbi:class I SAM-dependent methyltransferase [Mycobacteroides chelonae]